MAAMKDGQATGYALTQGVLSSTLLSGTCVDSAQNVSQLTTVKRHDRGSRHVHGHGHGRHRQHAINHASRAATAAAASVATSRWLASNKSSLHRQQLLRVLSSKQLRERNASEVVTRAPSLNASLIKKKRKGGGQINHTCMPPLALHNNQRRLKLRRLKL